VATEQVIEHVAEGLEDAAVHLDEAAEVTRQIDAARVGIFLGGMGVGLAVGFFFGYRFNRAKIKAEAFKESEAEIAKMREHYQQKTMVAEPKPTVEEVVEERGYSQRVTEEEVQEAERPTKPPVPVQYPKKRPDDHFVNNVAKRHVEREKDKDEGWNYPLELSQRSKDFPYIIHQDEFAQNETEYAQVTYTYYAVDHVLTDEVEEKVELPDQVVGLSNLGNFGHGADDYHVLFVRNDKLRMEFEICMLAASYDEALQGSSNDEPN
jgi:predicted GNAT family acetyltransferase